MDTSKIIKAVVGHGRYTTTEPIMKEDHGIYLQIENLELPASYEVDFSNSRKGGDSVTVIGDESGVLIPTQFIRDGKDVFAFLYWVGEDYGKTVYTFCIPNHVRPDRTNEQPEPEQQSVIDQAISALNTAVAQTAQDVLDADASAQSASASASSAAESASQAAESAQGTEEYATRAEAAQSAAESAQTAAETAAAIATQKASQASSAESAAASAAQTATSKAIEAAQIVEGVEGYAESAAASASQAQASAQTASTKASEASASASTASAKATEATTAAGTATTAKNDAVSAKTAAETAQAAAETAQGKAEDAAESVSGLASQIATNTADISDIKENLSEVEDALNNKAPVIIETASGSIASFSDGADGMPLKSLVVNIDPVQSGSGDPSPDNVRPISGWTGVTAQRTGKNLLDLSNLRQGNYSGAMNIRNVSFDEHQPIKGGQTYVWSSPLNDISGRYLKFYDADKIEFSDEVNLYGVGAKTFSVPSNARYFRCLWYRGTGIEPTDIVADQIELGSTATDYEPYNGNTYSVDWQSEAGTVYGGTIDVVSGVLTAYPYYPSYNGETLTGHWISDRDVYAEGTTPTTGAQVVDMGGEGTVYHLTPTEVQSILGQNHVWADTGDCSVEYRADTKLYIEKLTQPTEDDMTANSAITSGQFFMVGNTLYRALANIASGATITVGTNAQRVSLADALNLVNA